MKAETVYLFVFTTMADWEASFAIAGINNPRFQREPGRYRVVTVGRTKEPITTMGGVRILPDLTLDEISPAGSAMLILPGGDAWERGENTAAVAKAAEFLAVGVPVAAICAATFHADSCALPAGHETCGKTISSCRDLGSNRRRPVRVGSRSEIALPSGYRRVGEPQFKNLSLRRLQKLRHY